jgi:hypothetical protein
VNQPSNQRSSRCEIGEVRQSPFTERPSALSSSRVFAHVDIWNMAPDRTIQAHSDFSIENSVPPTLLATLITAQHARPFQPLPMIFPPILLFSSYLNLSNYKTDAAGITAAWSGLYALLAMRRSQVCGHHALFFIKMF